MLGDRGVPSYLESKFLSSFQYGFFYVVGYLHELLLYLWEWVEHPGVLNEVGVYAQFSDHVEVVNHLMYVVVGDDEVKAQFREIFVESFLPLVQFHDVSGDKIPITAYTDLLIGFLCGSVEGDEYLLYAEVHLEAGLFVVCVVEAVVEFHVDATAFNVA